MKILLLAILLAPLAQAETPSVKCDIETLADAQLCMQKVAKAYPDYEEPNDSFATENKAGLAEVLKIVGWEEGLPEAAQADFAGLMVEHGDEHHIYYFSMKKGKNVEVKELYDLNVVDLQYILSEPYSDAEMNPDTYFLGIDASDIDAYSDVVEYLDEIKQEAANH